MHSGLAHPHLRTTRRAHRSRHCQADAGRARAAPRGRSRPLQQQAARPGRPAAGGALPHALPVRAGRWLAGRPLPGRRCICWPAPAAPCAPCVAPSAPISHARSRYVCTLHCAPPAARRAASCARTSRAMCRSAWTTARRSTCPTRSRRAPSARCGGRGLLLARACAF